MLRRRASSSSFRSLRNLIPNSSGLSFHYFFLTRETHLLYKYPLHPLIRSNQCCSKKKKKRKKEKDFYNFVIYEGGKNSKRCFSRVRKFSKPRRRESRYTSHTSSRSIYVVDVFFYRSAGEIETNVARNEGISPTQRRRRRRRRQWLGGSCRSSNVQPPTLDALLLRRRWSIQARPITISTERDRGSESSLLPCNSGRLEPRRRRRRCRSRCYIRGISRGEMPNIGGGGRETVEGWLLKVIGKGSG